MLFILSAIKLTSSKPSITPYLQKKTEKAVNHTIYSLLIYIDNKVVGVAGFEPAASCSQSRRDNRATLHPESGCKYKTNF